MSREKRSYGNAENNNRIKKLKEGYMRIYKAILIVAFIVLTILGGCFDFDVNALCEAAADRPFMFVFLIILAGLFGTVTVNKFNTPDY
jgi:hypothetical protein